MRLYLVVAASGMLAMLSAGCSAAKSEAAERAEVLAAAMDAVAPKDVGGGATMTAARADGTTLVLTFEGLPAGEFDTPDYERRAIATLCEEREFHDVLANDVDIRIHMTSRDGRQKAVELKECA